MRSAASIVLLGLIVLAAPAQEETAQESTCLLCHGEKDLWEGEDVKYYVTAEKLSKDLHWQKGLRCNDCHGGDPTSDEYVTAHAEEKGFHKIATPADIPGFCGRCHSDLEFMRKYRPSARIDQEEEYWTSGHGQRLKKDPNAPVATCVSCHGHHGIVSIKELDSPVYPSNVAKTCAHCHADAELMKPFSYEGRPLGHDQYALWKESVHGRAMLEKGDLAAPTCNDCHGNHGALPPGVESVANACGTCHGRVAELFSNTRMRHRFEELKLPGCATCHGYHSISQPSDQLLGMQDQTFCSRCHAGGKFGATLAGAEAARHMRQDLEELKTAIHEATELVDRAERLGMEVGKEKFELQGAHTSLTKARTLVHSFSVEKMKEPLDEGLQVAATVQEQAQGALEEHTARRIWLGVSLLVIGAVMGLLLLFVRRYPVPTGPAGERTPAQDDDHG